MRIYTLYIILHFLITFIALNENEDIRLKKGIEYDFEIGAEGIFLVSKEEISAQLEFQLYDRSGIAISQPQYYNSSAEFYAPVISIKNHFIATVWQDKIGPFASNRYIGGNISIKNSDINNFNISISDNSEDAYYYTPDLCFIDDTTIVSVWTGYDSQNIFNIYGQIITSNCTKVGDNFIICPLSNTSGISGGVKVINRKGTTEFLVIWSDSKAEGDELYGRLYNKEAIPSSDCFKINKNFIEGNLYSLDIEPTLNDAVIVLYQSMNFSGEPETTLQFTVIDYNGNCIIPFTEVTDTNNSGFFSDVTVSANDDNEFILVWEKEEVDSRFIYAQIYDASANKIGDAFKVSSKNSDGIQQYEPKVILIGDTAYCAWIENVNRDRNIYLKIFDLNYPVSAHDEAQIMITKKPFELLGNHPNPFNSSTKIQYQLFERNDVSIHIYDITGQLILNINYPDQKPGNYCFDWNGEAMQNNEPASGIYFYKFSVGRHKQTKKMLLIK